MRRILIIFLCFFSFQHLYAVRALPRPVQVKQPDGSVITVLVKGDEFFNYTTTIDGYIIAQKKDGFYYYANYDTDKLIISDFKVGNSMSHSLFRSKEVPYIKMAKAKQKRIERHLDYTQRIRRVFSDEQSKAEYKTIVIPVQFNDVKFVVNSPETHFENMVNQENYADYGGTGSVKQYFTDNLGDFFDFTFSVSNVITLPEDIAYYCSNDDDADLTDVRVRDAVVLACDMASKQGLDFSQCDVDGDGVVDNLVIIFAGGSEASGAGDQYVWPHSWSVRSLNHRVNGVYLGTYACSAEYDNDPDEVGGIGVLCHEFGHTLGFIDIYDTDYEAGGQADGFWGVLDLMDSGCYNNNGRTPPTISIVHRDYIGVADLIPLNADEDCCLENVYNSNKGYIVSSVNDGEYLLFECRVADGWDSYIDAPGGLLVYHIDRSKTVVDGVTAETRWFTNTANAYAEHPCAYALEANYPARSHKDLFFPGDNNITSLNARTEPLFLDWSGANFGVALSNIAYDGNTVSFQTIKEEDNIFPEVEDFEIIALQNEAFLTWNYDLSGSYEWNIIWNKVDGDPLDLKLGKTVKNSFNIKELDDGADYVCGVFSIVKEVSSDTLYQNFTTGNISSIYPYLYMPKAEYLVGDKLYLKVQNLTDKVKFAQWTINGRAVFSGEHTLKEVGEFVIGVKLTYSSDNSVEHITRKIVVKANENEVP